MHLKRVLDNFGLETEQAFFELLQDIVFFHPVLRMALFINQLFMPVFVRLHA